MTTRQIINIDEDKCNGCGLCIPNCPEGALQIIDEKVRLISDLFCDGLGACIGHCPQGAIQIETREAEPYDERRVMENIAKQGTNVIKAHLEHLKDHGETEHLKKALEVLKEKGIQMEETMKHEHQHGSCPGAALREIKNETTESALRQWPVQLSLLPPQAPFFDNSHLLVSADCVPFANASFHSKLLSGKSVVIGCPKLDDVQAYQEKLTEIFKHNRIKSVTVAIMEVPCCHGLYSAVEQALEESGKKIPLIQEIVSVDGTIQ